MTRLVLIPLDPVTLRPCGPAEPFPPAPDPVDAADRLAARRERAASRGVEWIDRDVAACE